MKNLTSHCQSLIGMVHVRALPGTPQARLSPTAIIDKAIEEARLLEECGFDAILIENMHDRPYLNRRVGPEIVAMMTAVGHAIRREIASPLGVQILAGDNMAALATAHAIGARFIRAECFVYTHIADEGLMNGDAGQLLRYRRMIGAENILIVADIKKKHSSHAITADVGLAETAQTAQFFGADALIVTGSATGKAASPHDLGECADATTLPCLIGSGTTPGNLTEYLPAAAGFIVGSSIKAGGRWDAEIDVTAASRLVEAFHKATGRS